MIIRVKPARGALTSGICMLLIVALLVTGLLSIEPFLNGPVKRNLLQAANEKNEGSLSLGRMSFDPLTGALSIDSLRTVIDGDPDARFITTLTSLACSGIDWFSLIRGAGLRVHNVFIGGAVVEQVRRSESKTERPGAVVPSRNSPLFPLSIGAFKLENGSLSGEYSIAHVVLSGASLEVPSVDAVPWQVLGRMTGVKLSMDRIALRFASSGYMLRIGSFLVSSGDSIVRAQDIQYAALAKDSAFFASRAYRSTRFVVKCGTAELGGVEWGKLAERGLGMRTALFDSLFLDILLNKRAPPDPRDPAPSLPGELMSDLPWQVRADSVVVRKGTVWYAESFPYSQTPAVLRWGNVNATGRLAGGAKTPQPVAVLQLSGYLMNSARMTLDLDLPLVSSPFTCAYRGSLDAMDLKQLNDWLEVCDRTRITSGYAEGALFDITIKGGKASGLVRATYRNLRFELLNKKSGNPGGFLESLGTFIANTFKIHETNPAKSGKTPRTGKVDYQRKPGDTFLSCLWFALRSGLGSVVGF